VVVVGGRWVVGGQLHIVSFLWCLFAQELLAHCCAM
jgi:hypothetical protein